MSKQLNVFRKNICLIFETPGLIFRFAILTLVAGVLTACLEGTNATEIKHPLPSHSGKYSPIVIGVRVVDQVPHSSSAHCTIEAEIQHTKASAQDVFYKWVLDDGIQIVEGALEGSIPSLTPRNPQKISIVVKGFTDAELKHVSISANIDQDGFKIGASANVVSTPEQTFESVAPLIQEALDADKKNQEAPPPEPKK